MQAALFIATAVVGVLGYAVGYARGRREQLPRHLAGPPSPRDVVVSRLAGLDLRFDSLDRRMADVEKAAARAETEARMLSAHLMRARGHGLRGVDQ